jgi:hypothetical protein
MRVARGSSASGARNREPANPRHTALAARTNEEYRRWAQETFGRIGRDPARIEPFLARLGEVWLRQAKLSFCSLVCVTVPSGLQLVGEPTFLQLLDAPGSMDYDTISDMNTSQGPLGDLLRSLERHKDDPSP